MKGWYVDKYLMGERLDYLKGEEFESLEEALDFIKREAPKLEDDEELILGKGTHDKFM